MQYSCNSYRRQVSHDYISVGLILDLSRYTCTSIRELFFLPSYQWIRDYFQLYANSGGSVIDCLTRDRGDASSNLVGGTALSSSKKLYTLLRTG